VSIFARPQWSDARRGGWRVAFESSGASLGESVRGSRVEHVHAFCVRHVATLLLATLLASTATPATANAGAPRAPVVEVAGERLIGTAGTRHAEVAAFKGIPFAAPPVGERRWQAPAKPVPRPGPRDASRFAPACFQDDYNTAWYRKVGAAFGEPPTTFVPPPVSEDCLYLNVWTPAANAGERLPVMVWIYGGSNYAGWSFEPNYDGEELAARGRVVVVTLAYRVGIFGFFGHPQLRGTTAPANFGLLDQIAALEWVRDHVRAFDGDPDRVTLFGESAGAGDIGRLLTSPRATRLFRRAISQSGGFQARDFERIESAEAIGSALAVALGVDGLDALRRVPAADVLAAATRVVPSRRYAPVIDGRVLKTSAIEAYRRDGIRADLMIGTNDDEWYMYVDGDPRALDAELDALPEGARAVVRGIAEAQPDPRRAHDRATTFVRMVCPGYLMASAARRTGARAWVYRFMRVRPGDGGRRLLAYHGAEIPYVFGTHDAWLPREPADDALTDAMLGYWSRFAHTGDPNGEGAAPWPAWSAVEPRVLRLDARIDAADAPDHGACLRAAKALYTPPAAPR
jgi:para-nitrobenzyl esterase